MDLRKKYQLQQETPYPHIGSMLKSYFLKNKLNQSAIARDLGITQSGMGRYLKHESLQMGIIWKISLSSNYNFLAALAEQLPIGFETKKETALQQELFEKNKIIEKLEIELAVYKSITGK